jgi:hypothetical protein
MFAVVLDRFVQQCPLAVMARMTLQRALRPEWVDALFESHREWQYTRELTFSTVVEITSLVALGMSPSLHAAARRDGTLTVSMSALYAKVNHTEPALLRALVRGSAEQLLPVVEPLRAKRTPLLPGFRVRVVDGNHLPAATPSRTLALPGAALPAAHGPRDPVSGSHALVPARHASPAPADARGCSRCGDPGATAPLRRPSGSRRASARLIAAELPPPRARRRPRRSSSGPAGCPRCSRGGGGCATALVDVRRREGHASVRPLPASRIGVAVAGSPRDGLFRRLARARQRSHGRRRGALMSDACPFNVLSTLQTAVETAHALAPEEDVVSTWHLAQEVRSHYTGMMVALPAEGWTALVEASPKEFTRTLLRFAQHVDLRHVRKNPRKPKVVKPKGYAPRKAVQRHVSTARVLADGGVR